MALTRTRPPKPPEPDDNLFDESSGYEDDKGIQVAAGLSEQEKRQAATLYRLFNELWGLCIVRGDPGAGKDTFLNWLLYTLKRYFPQKRILRDEKPRKLFGSYAGLFNEERIREDLKRMREFAKSARKKAGGQQFDGSYTDALEKAADEWAGSDGASVLLHDSIVGLTEYHKYVYNREPHNPMNKTMGGIHKVGRHLNALIVGCTQLESDLDRKTCKPFINWRVTCSRSARDSTRYIFFIEKVKYDKRLDILTPIGRPFAIPVDAGRPRRFIGDGRIVVKKQWYKPENEEERVVLDVLNSGVDRYENLVELIESGGDMSEFDVLRTLKRLCLKLPGEKLKGVVWYPCYYFIFNSRSAPQMRTKVRVEED